MKYSIIEIEEKTGKSGGKYYPALFKTQDEAGEEIKASSFDLAGAKIGDIVEGEIVQNGQFKNFNLKKEAKTGGYGGGNKTAAIEKAQDRKEESINKTLDRKEDSFKVSATFRDATILTQVWADKSPFPLPSEIEDKWLYFRKWLWQHYDVNEPF